MQFNLDSNKQANEVCFSTDDYIPIKLNDSPVQLCESQKYLGVTLDEHFNFHEHIKKKKFCNKMIGTVKHLSVYLPIKSLLMICNSFVQPQLDYGDRVYDNLANESIINKLERVQYKVCLLITGAIQVTLRESFYKELVLVSPQSRRWYGKMIFFYKILNGLTPKYLFDIIPVSNDSCYNARAQF